GSDDTACLSARHAEELGKHYTIYAPRLEIVETILDKQRLWQSCNNAGVSTLPSWFPESLADVARLAPQLDFPLLIKPRQHLFRIRREKGMVVGSARDLEGAFSAFVRREPGGAEGATGPEQPLPMIQAFIGAAVENVVSLTGFIDRTGTRTIMSANRKVLQRSRPVGVGLAFEGIALPARVAEDALRLC